MRANNKDYKTLSRQFIVESLLEIMHEKPYCNITITEITDRAEIARRTFYFNFSSKDEVLQEYLELLFQRFTKNLKSHDAKNVHEYAVAYFEVWKQEADFLSLLQKNNMFDLLLEKFENILESNTIEKIYNEFHLHLEKNEESYFNKFNAAGLWTLLNLWIENGMKETVTEMANLYIKIMHVDTNN